MATTDRILIVVTNADQFEKAGFRTGLWLGELVHFWDVAEEAGFEMQIVSPEGGAVPLDPESLIMGEMATAVGLGRSLSERYADRAFMDLLQDTTPVADVSADAFDAIYLTGGHGVMFDFPDDAALPGLIAQFADTGRIVSAVCHGPAGLLNVRTRGDRWLLEGRAVTGFSWTEEKLAKRAEAVPFDLEDELRARGAHFEKALLPFAGHVVEDGRLITGQNPNSARGVGEAVVAALRAD